MGAAVTNKEHLAEEYAAYRKVHRIVSWFHYASLAALFIYLCKLIMDSHGFVPMTFFILVKEALSVAGIWFLFYLCDAKRGFFKLLWYWERSLLSRSRHEEALDVLREGGIYFIDDTEMTLVDGFLVPLHRVK